MKALEKSREKPQREQFKERAENAKVDKAVGERLPEISVQKGMRIESKRARNLRRSGGRRTGDPQREKSRQVNEDQPAGGPAEIGKGKRGGAYSWHRSHQGKRWGGPVS